MKEVNVANFRISTYMELPSAADLGMSINLVYAPATDFGRCSYLDLASATVLGMSIDMELPPATDLRMSINMEEVNAACFPMSQS